MTLFLRIILGLVLIAFVGGLTIAGQPFKAAQPEPTGSKDAVVATIDGQSVTLREIEKNVALPLYLLEVQRQQLLQQALQSLIDERLLEAEASRKGVTLPQLLEEASQSESISRLANLPAPVKRLSPVGQQAALDGPEQARIRQALLISLRRSTDVHVSLPSVVPPVFAVDTNGDRRMGPDRAPITIVEFSDFQCPYCRQGVKILKTLRQLYGDRIRIVYRDYLGPNHPYALQAAEAARCAGEQGKFWEYHDLLFDRQSTGTGWDFRLLAKELGLQPSAFDSCLRSGRFRDQIAKDLHEGLKLGITSTPTFFINGRPLVGAQPLSRFQALIDTELARQPLS
ncbi:MAG TPA: DsbA family protein [Nitrospira sp.]|nr:DsbA family protein [Nitrospira sp.]